MWVKRKFDTSKKKLSMAAKMETGARKGFQDPFERETETRFYQKNGANSNGTLVELRRHATGSGRGDWSGIPHGRNMQ